MLGLRLIFLATILTGRREYSQDDVGPKCKIHFPGASTAADGLSKHAAQRSTGLRQSPCGRRRLNHLHAELSSTATRPWWQRSSSPTAARVQRLASTWWPRSLLPAPLSSLRTGVRGQAPPTSQSKYNDAQSAGEITIHIIQI